MSRHRFSSFLFPCLFGLLLAVININQAKAADFSISIGYGAPFVSHYDLSYHHHHGIHSGYFRQHGGYAHRPDYHHGYQQHKRHDKHHYYDKRALYGHHRHDDRGYYKHRYGRD